MISSKPGVVFNPGRKNLSSGFPVDVAEDAACAGADCIQVIGLSVFRPGQILTSTNISTRYQTHIAYRPNRDKGAFYGIQATESRQMFCINDVSLVTFLSFYIAGIGEHQLLRRKTAVFQSLIRGAPEYSGGFHDDAAWIAALSPLGKRCELRLRGAELRSLVPRSLSLEVVPLVVADEHFGMHIHASGRGKDRIDGSPGLSFSAVWAGMIPIATSSVE